MAKMERLICIWRWKFYHCLFSFSYLCFSKVIFLCYSFQDSLPCKTFSINEEIYIWAFCLNILKFNTWVSYFFTKFNSNLFWIVFKFLRKKETRKGVISHFWAGRNLNEFFYFFQPRNGRL